MMRAELVLCVDGGVETEREGKKGLEGGRRGRGLERMEGGEACRRALRDGPRL